MELSRINLNLFNNKNNSVKSLRSSLPAGNSDNLKPLEKDTVSFKETAHNSRSALSKDEARKVELAKIKNEIGEEAIKNADAKKILPYFGIDVKENENGLLTISEYRQPSEECTFKDLGIDENKLLQNVEHIDGDAVFDGSQLTNLGQLQSIGGNAIFSRSKITDLGQLQSIGGNADFIYSRVTNLGQLKSVGGFAQFVYSGIKNLGQLQYIGEDANFSTCSCVTDLGQLQYVGGNVYLDYYGSLERQHFKDVEVKGRFIS